MAALSFPLYHGFFPQLALSVDEVVAYRRLGKERVSQLVRIVEDADCVYTWSDVKHDNSNHTTSSSKKRHATAHAAAKCQRATFVDVRPDSKAAQPCTLLKASVHIVDVTADEVLAALAKSRTKDVRKTMAYMHGDRFIDAQTLLTFPTSAASTKPAYSYRAIKWCALRTGATTTKATSSTPQMLDFCYLEYAGRKKAHPGSSVLGFIVQESLSADREVPRLDAFGLTRAPLTRSGVVVARTHQSNILKVTAVCQIDGALSAPLRAAMESVLLAQVASIQRVKGLLERQRMGRLQYLEEWEWVATSDRKACAVCLRGFTFHRKHHCQTCGEVVCSSCAPLRELDEPLFDATTLRVCTACLASAGSSGLSATERTSSNDATEAYMRELQHPPTYKAAAPMAPTGRELAVREVPKPAMPSRHRPVRLSASDSSDGDHVVGGSGLVRGSNVSRLRATELEFGSYNAARTSATGAGGRASRRSATMLSTGSSASAADTLSKLAYHMQQIRETIDSATADVDPTHAQAACDDVYDRILQIRETLDGSGSDFGAVLAAIGGGSASGSGSGSHDGKAHRRRHSVGDSDDSFRYSSSNDSGSELNVSYSYSSSSFSHDDVDDMNDMDDDDDNDSLLFPDGAPRPSTPLSRYSSDPRSSYPQSSSMASQPRSSYPQSSYRRSSVPRSSQWRSSLSQSSRASDGDVSSVDSLAQSGGSLFAHPPLHQRGSYYSSSSSPRGGGPNDDGDGVDDAAHKHSRISDQTVASSASKQSSDSKRQQSTQPSSLHDAADSALDLEQLEPQTHRHHHHHEHLEHVMKLNSRRGIDRLAQKIEKLQQRLEDSRRAASVVSSNDGDNDGVESEPEPEALRAPRQQRRTSFVESKVPPVATSATSSRSSTTSSTRRSSTPHVANDMVQALRGVMESRELTQTPPAWRRSFSSARTHSNAPSSAASSASSRRSRSSRTSAGGRSTSAVLVGLPSSGSSSNHSEPTTMLVYDEDSEHKLQRLSISTPATLVDDVRDDSIDVDTLRNADDFDDEDDGQDEEFSISSSSEDGRPDAFVSVRHSLARGGRDMNDGAGRLRLYPPASPSSRSLGASSSLEEGDDNVASLPSPHSLLFASAKQQAAAVQTQTQLLQQQQKLGCSIDNDDCDSVEATRRLIEDVSCLPARMRTSSGQSSGAPSQESHDF